jgi:hypothetical protein
VAEATLDGASVDARIIPIRNDGVTHYVQVVLGDSKMATDGTAARRVFAPG